MQLHFKKYSTCLDTDNKIICYCKTVAKSCPVLMLMLASSLTILGMHLQSKAQHCSSYIVFSNIGTVLGIAVCCNISSPLCRFWWPLTLKLEGGQSAFCRFLLLQHTKFPTKPRLSLDSVIPPLGKFRVFF